MPRERVHHGQLYVVDKTTTTTGHPGDGIGARPFIPGELLRPDQLLREEISLDVHWNRDGEYVQISLHAPTDWWQRFFDSHKDDTDVIAYDAFTDRLSRREINNMIKVLRRARDTAYGSDE